MIDREQAAGWNICFAAPVLFPHAGRFQERRHSPNPNQTFLNRISNNSLKHLQPRCGHHSFIRNPVLYSEEYCYKDILDTESPIAPNRSAIREKGLQHICTIQLSVQSYADPLNLLSHGRTLIPGVLKMLFKR